MKTIWYDNQPKHKPGDLVLYYSESGRFNDVGVAGIVDNVSVAPYSEKRKANIEKSNSERRDCCGKKSVNSGLNEIIYKLEDGKEVHENMVRYSGVKELNNLIKHLREEIKYEKGRIRKIGLAMGLDEWDIPT